MSDTSIIHWTPSKVRVTGFSTVGRGRNGVTTVRVDMQVSDPWELGDLMRQLADLQAQPAPKGKS